MLHMLWAKLLRDRLCNNYSGVYLVLQLLTTISIAILHTTLSEVARLYYYPCCGYNFCYQPSCYKERSCNGRSICNGYQVETLCGNNMDCFKFWHSYISQWHPVLPQVTAHPASVNHTCYRTVGVHGVSSKELSSRGLMSQQAHTSPLQNH